LSFRRAALVVLDVVPESGTPGYEERSEMLESLTAADGGSDTPCGVLILTPTMRVASHADALAFYQRCVS
jgi:hypothetical protein